MLGFWLATERTNAAGHPESSRRAKKDPALAGSSFLFRGETCGAAYSEIWLAFWLRQRKPTANWVTFLT